MLWVTGRPLGHRVNQIAAPDGMSIPYREWHRPDGRAAILYLHGQGGHSGPFAEMGDLLHEAGFCVYAHDHRGFGLSKAPRGDIASYDLYIRDGLTMLGEVEHRNPGLPIFLLGFSMGGHLALRLAARARPRLSGLIALSPGFKLKHSPPRSAVLRGLWALLTRPGKPLPSLPGGGVSTRNPVHLEGQRNDESWVTSYSPRFHFGAVRSIRKAWREASQLDLSVLFVQAGDDDLICPVEARRFFDRIPHRDKRFWLLPGVAHNLTAEAEMPQVVTAICTWISERI